MAIPKEIEEKITKLENVAEDIENKANKLITNAPLKYFPTLDQYDWSKPLPSELRDLQSEIIGEYRGWYEAGLKLLEMYYNSETNEFQKYYQYKDPSRCEGGVLEYLQFEVDIYGNNKIEVFGEFLDVFSKQKNILSSIKHIDIEINKEIINENAEKKVILILEKFHRFAKQLEQRQGKSTIPKIDIKNEYDVQDLLHAVLKLEFDDVRAEEYVPSYAGSNSRMDFLLKEEQIVIEVKKTSDNLKDKEIGAQLNDDSAKYRNHQNCKTLYCFIYDPDELISNPYGIENDLSKDVEGFKVIVIICPKR